MPRYSLKARYVLPVDAPPILDGVVQVEGSTIAKVGKTCDRYPVTELGDVVLLPALVNAHTHLEFSDLQFPLCESNSDFADWIRAVLSHRARSTAGGPRSVAGTSSVRGGSGGGTIAAISLGLEESIRSGVGVLGEISTSSSAVAPWEATPVRGITFLELIALSPARVEELCDLAARHLNDVGQHARWRVGLSPHAPYTASRELVRRAVDLAVDRRACVAMHIAETRDELRLLRDGAGSLRDLLEERKVWQDDAFSPGTRPLDYLRLLSRAVRSLVIHGNYLDDEEIGYLAQRRGHMSVVYCPRTHAYFDHEPYPLASMLDAGVNVALGTDSRASNPDLDLLQEMRFVAGSHADVSPGMILRMGTLHGARALGVENRHGSLATGKAASMVAIPLFDPQTTDPLPDILNGDAKVALVVLDGDPVVANESLQSQAMAIQTAP